MELPHRNLSGGAVGPRDLYGRAQRAQRHRHVARASGDAQLVRAEHRMDAIEAANRAAAAAGAAFVAWLVDVVEVIATGPLAQAACGSGLVSALECGACQDGSRQLRVTAAASH